MSPFNCRAIKCRPMKCRYTEEEMLLASSEEPEAGAEPLAVLEKKNRDRTNPTSGSWQESLKGSLTWKTFDEAEKDNLLGVVITEGHPYTVLT